MHYKCLESGRSPLTSSRSCWCLFDTSARDIDHRGDHHRPRPRREQAASLLPAPTARSRPRRSRRPRRAIIASTISSRDFETNSNRTGETHAHVPGAAEPVRTSRITMTSEAVSGTFPMRPDTPPAWKYFGPRPPICQRCGVPTTIKSKRTANEFVYGCVWCGTEAVDRIASIASAPSSSR
jgi:hypothetical protein